MSLPRLNQGSLCNSGTTATVAEARKIEKYGELIFFSIRYHGSSSPIKCQVYHHVGGRRHTPVVCNESREPHTSHYTSRPVSKKTTNKLLKPATMQSTGEIFFNCFDIKVKKIRLYVINFFKRISVAHSF